MEPAGEITYGMEREIPFYFKSILIIICLILISAQVVWAGGKHAAAGNLAGSEEVVRIDGKVFSRDEMIFYIQEVLQANLPREGSKDYSRYVNSFVIDWAGYPYVEEEFPRIKEAPSVAAEIHKAHLDLLNKAYFKFLFLDNVELTVDNVADSIKYDKRNFDLSLLVNQSQEKVLEAYQRIREGMSFPEAVKQYSDGFSRSKGGDIGLVEDGANKQFNEAEFAIIRNTLSGECTIPFETRIGWMIVRVNRIVEPEEIRHERAKQIYPRKKLEMAQVAYARTLKDLRASAEVVFDNTVLDAIYNSTVTGNPLSPDLQTTPVARAGSIEIFPSEVSDLAFFHDRDDMVLRIRKAVDQELVARDAARKGFDGREDFRRLMEIRRRHAGVREYFQKKMDEFANSEAREFRSFFESRKEDFRTDEKRELWVIEVKSREEADAIRAGLDDGVDFAEVGAKRNRDERGRKARGLVGMVVKKQLHPAIAEIVFSTPRDGVAGPIAVEPGQDKQGNTVWVLLKVGRIEPGVIVEYEEMDKERIRNRYVLSKMTAFQKEFLDRIREEHDVVTSRGGEL